MYGFYVNYSTKQLIISNLVQDRVRKKYGNKIELVNSVKDKESLALVKERVIRNFRGFEIVELLEKPKYIMTPEHKQALINSKLGKPRSEEVKRKISQTKKGKVSNFKGKTHSYETKRVMAARKLGNKHAQDLIWIYNPDTDDEAKVRSRKDIPKGYSEGRDYYSVEPGLYEMQEYQKRKNRSNSF